MTVFLGISTRSNPRAVVAPPHLRFASAWAAAFPDRRSPSCTTAPIDVGDGSKITVPRRAIDGELAPEAVIDRCTEPRAEKWRRCQGFRLPPGCRDSRSTLIGGGRETSSHLREAADCRLHEPACPTLVPRFGDPGCIGRGPPGERSHDISLPNRPRGRVAAASPAIARKRPRRGRPPCPRRLHRSSRQ
jgi:hypothetical protein